MKSRLPWILLTSLLCGGAFYFGYQFGGKKNSSPQPVSTTETNSREVDAQPSPDYRTNVQPFQWSQLESTDYRSYIANLRGIGCPEQTIRDIITADVDSVFAKRRDKLTESTAGAPMRDSLTALRQEEDQFLIRLLDPQSDTGAEIAATPQPARLLRAKSPDSIPALPLVLQNVDLTALKLNSSQMEIIDNLRQKFREEIAAGSDTNDPAYRERWLKAQHESDSLLRGMLGTDVYVNYQELAANQQSQGPVQ
jgi:hypothetical protein